VARVTDVMWTPWDEPGLERLKRTIDSQGCSLRGDVILGRGNHTFLVQYAIACDANWHVQNFRVDVDGQNRMDCSLGSDDRWQSASGGESLSEFEGCAYIDLSITPSTNTLAVGYAPITPGQSKTIDVFYIDFDDLPDLKLSRARQRYTHLGERSDRTYYRFEHLDNGFMAELPFDSSNLILDYPDLFRRVWQREV
jgi:hypothetical protein